MLSAAGFSEKPAAETAQACTENNTGFSPVNFLL